LKIEFKSQDSKLVKLHVADIVPDKNQPRKNIDTEMIKELARSIAETGQIGPIVVRSLKNGKYLIVVGERRWRAAIEAGLQYVDCIVRVDIDDRKALEMQLAENYQREEIPPLGQARAFKAYIDKYKVSQRELSRRTGIPQRTISSRLALLSLPVSMHAQIETGHIGPHEALMISELPPAYQPTVATLVASGKLGSQALKSLCTMSKANPNVPINELISQKEHAPALPPSQSTKEPVSLDAATAVPNSTTAGLLLSASQFQDLTALIQVIKEQGTCQVEDCELRDDDGRCTAWSWDNRGSIPEGIGEPVCLEPSKWVVKPSVLLCGICSQWALHLISQVLDMLWNSPLTKVREDFKCGCGAKGEVAVHIKCTKCRKETWWGWWPK
jgi:ParB/RepB/Spo0J family partition protein